MQLSLLEESRLRAPGVDDAEHVARVADLLLNELAIEPPISLRIVASYQGIGSILDCNQLPNAACLLTDPTTGKLQIRLRASDPRRRKRFSGFHEVAHTFMPGYQLRMQMRCDPPVRHQAKPTLETLCDGGAGALLLPHRFLAADLAEAEFGMSLLDQVADAYDASLQASAHRIVELWPEDAMFLVAEVQNKPSERCDPGAPEKLRVSYSSPRGRWPFVPRFKSIDPEDPLSRALQGELVDERTTLQGFVAHPVESVHVSARLCPFTDSRGERHDRVLALYRRPAR